MMTKPYIGSMLLLVATITHVACGERRTEAPTTEPVTLSVTNWTDQTELFMEYPPLVTNQPARFAVHLTTLSDFKALNAGKPSAEFVPEAGGPAIVFAGTPPLRPGVFRVEGTPPAPGRYRWALTIDAPGLIDRHDLGIVAVHADQTGAETEVERRPVEDATAFSYLKEQQWVNEFATAPVREAEIRSVIRVPASIQPLTGGEAVVAAPTAGRFAADTLLPIGSLVKSGQILGRLEPRLSSVGDRSALVAEVAEAQTTAEAARTEQVRAERLLAERAVPARRVEDARRAVTIAEARLSSAQSRLAQRDETLRSGGGAAGGNAFVLRAPISGRLTNVDATLGASYEEGAFLFKIVRTDRVEVQAHVPSSDVAAVRDVESLALELAGQTAPVPLTPRRMHDAGVLDPQTRALAVQFDVDNPGGRLLIGQSGTVVLYQKQRIRMPVVTREAVLMEAGRPFVFVQVSGESFARRPIEIGGRDGDLVGIRSGLAPGDRVVTRGAYDVQLASASRGLPAEGHVH